MNQIETETVETGEFRDECDWNVIMIQLADTEPERIGIQIP